MRGQHGIVLATHGPASSPHNGIEKPRGVEAFEMNLEAASPAIIQRGAWFLEIGSHDPNPALSSAGTQNSVDGV
jgi:hypothetical protein